MTVLTQPDTKHVGYRTLNIFQVQLFSYARHDVRCCVGEIELRGEKNVNGVTEAKLRLDEMSHVTVNLIKICTQFNLFADWKLTPFA